MCVYVYIYIYIYIFSYALLARARARNPLNRLSVVCLSVVRVCGGPILLMAGCGLRACRLHHSAAVFATFAIWLRTCFDPFL